MTTRNYPLSAQRNVMPGVLIVLAAAAWAVLVRQASMMDDDDMTLTMGMGAPLFITLGRR